jgi:uncharacterized protein YprB with RNaseH-like and TPR domain
VTPLADRIRYVLQTPGQQGAGLQPSVSPHSPVTDPPHRIPETGRDGKALESLLGGEWRHQDDATCFVVNSRRDPMSSHGRETVGTLAERVAESLEDAAVLTAFPVRAPLLFFDLETTGLSGGAGTYPFLIGCGWFDDDGAFVTRQFVMVRFADERSVLGAVAGELARAGALVSFNGRSFDAPLLEMRYLYHRLAWAAGALPHVDMLHVARRFWKRDDAQVESSCSLVALERRQLGHRRLGDVPGVEIPARYFHFVRTGDARPLAAVFDHNRLDLLSLAALTARALHLVRAGPQAARDPREALALGWIYTRAGLDEPARDAYRRAATLAPSSAIHIEALRGLAVSARRARSYDEAAAYWRQILDVRGCSRPAAREASEALAIHHEHRVRDLVMARTFARRSLEQGTTARSNEAGEYRLKRIQRKLEQSEVARLMFADIPDVRPQH